jgi:hypothetical protein
MGLRLLGVGLGLVAGPGATPAPERYFAFVGPFP